MAVRELDTTPRLARPPRAMAWVLLLASTAAVLLAGIVATGLVFGTVGVWPAPPAAFWIRLAGAGVLTIVSLAIRSLRWVFLLRRAEIRIPIRDAYIGYFSGFILLFAPLLLGEIAVRAIVLRRRGGVPIVTTAVVNVWERGLDLVALSLIGCMAAIAAGRDPGWIHVVGALAMLSLVPAVRRKALGIVLALVAPVARTFQASEPRGFGQLTGHQAWLTSLVASVVAWTLTGAGFWLVAGSWGQGLGIVDAEYSYSASAGLSGIMLAPGGVLVAGRQMLDALSAHGTPTGVAALAVVGVRLATVGVSVALGAIFGLVHLRTTAASSERHFDDIADAYDVQIPQSRRHALLDRKTALMKEVIESRGVGRRGLDVGCGQGAYVGRMRQLGFDVAGIDASAGQIELAVRNVGERGVVGIGSVLDIPAEDNTFDFLYIINVLHHLGSVDEQRRAFAELLRVVRPGGLLFVHEINTRNILFRFYMGYVFPSLNCIDEGVERWLLPHRMQPYTETPVADTRYFTFLPDFVPQSIVRPLRPLEAWLERSPLKAYSAHYMCVFVKGSEASR